MVMMMRSRNMMMVMMMMMSMFVVIMMPIVNLMANVKIRTKRRNLRIKSSDFNRNLGDTSWHLRHPLVEVIQERTKQFKIFNV